MKKLSTYSALIEARVYERTPKAVLAAIIVSLLVRDLELDDKLLTWSASNVREKITAALLEEWAVLHENGIVPQKPVKP